MYLVNQRKSVYRIRNEAVSIYSPIKKHSQTFNA